MAKRQFTIRWENGNKEAVYFNNHTADVEAQKLAKNGHTVELFVTTFTNRHSSGVEVHVGTIN